MIDLRDLQVMRGSYRRKDLREALAWALQHRAELERPGESSMTKHDDDIVLVGGPLPRLVSVSAMDGFNAAVVWEAGTPPKEREITDLAPAVLRYKVYARLRDDPDLFRTIHLQDHRFGVTWGDMTDMDMSAATIANMADETMQSQDFSEFMKRHGFTLDQVAAELGISRRMAAYYKKEHKVPRYIALACAYVDLRAGQIASVPGTAASAGMASAAASVGLLTPMSSKPA